MSQSPYGGRGPLVVGVMWTETTIAIVFVFLRIYTRYIYRKPYGLDDLLTIIAWVGLLMYGIMATIATTYGFGNHVGGLTPQEEVKSNFYEIIGQTIWIFSMPICKGAIIFLLLRIFRTAWHRYVLYGVFGTLWITWGWSGFTEWLQCYPFEHTYNTTIEATCWLSSEQYTKSAFFVAAWTIFIDVFLIIFPIHIIWQLHAGKREKLTIIVLLSGGIFSAICGTVKTVQLSELNAKPDYTYETVPLILWSNTELWATIIMACVPPMQPLLSKWIFGREYSHPSYDQQRPRSSSGGQRTVGSKTNWMSRRKDPFGDFELASDSGSGKGILTSAQGTHIESRPSLSPGQIERTHEVSVESEELALPQVR